MLELKTFNNPEFGTIRTIVEDGRTLFCGTDAARALGYANADGAIRRHCRSPLKRRVGVQTGSKADGTPAMQMVEMSFIPDGDLCRLAAKSELPGASKFEGWIFDDVIPSVLRTGAYSIAAASPRPLLPEGVTFSSAVGFMRLARRVMLDTGASPFDVGMMIKETCEAINFPVPPSLVKQIPGQIYLFRAY